MFETLEARRLMTATVTFGDGVVATQSGSGSLVVKAATANPMNVNVIENGISQTQGGVQIGLGNVLVQDLVTLQEYVFYNVKTTKPVVIQGGHGNETVNFDGTTVRSQITGGSGSDYIYITDRGDNGGSTADGGKGNDMIAVVFSHHATISGGDGDDVLIVNSSCQYDCTVAEPLAGDLIVVNGGNGNDTIIVYDGNARVDGGSGIDNLLVDVSNGSNVSFKNVEAVNVM
jgi:Ca2+-binding RTX toxin-like protein